MSDWTGDSIAVGILIVALLLAIVNYWLSEICEAIERIAEK